MMSFTKASIFTPCQNVMSGDLTVTSSLPQKLVKLSFCGAWQLFVSTYPSGIPPLAAGRIVYNHTC
jgi:hypothetical protein